MRSKTAFIQIQDNKTLDDVNRDLKVLEVTETQNSEFVYTYQLNAPITPDVIRFDFNQELTEVYEIEVF